jgi:hypothetical protein
LNYIQSQDTQRLDKYKKTIQLNKKSAETKPKEFSNALSQLKENQILLKESFFKKTTPKRKDVVANPVISPTTQL